MKAQQTTCHVNPAWAPQELPTAAQAVEMNEGKIAARSGQPFTQTNGKWFARGWMIYHLLDAQEPSRLTH